jgi:hypothetical protein
MTLSEFLLARIAEDEVSTWELIPYRCEPDCCAPAGWVGHRCLICRTEEFGGMVQAISDIASDHDERIHRRSRVLAECEAKRRIVAEAGSWFPRGNGQAVLRLLALSYANHPDYREEWKP